MGADSQFDYGDYYAWGETSIKQEYTLTTYLYFNDKNGDGTLHSFYESDFDVVPKELRFLGHDIAGTTFDAARWNIGYFWGMPSRKQWKELKENCSWVWHTENGKLGYMVTGPNGNSIFLPAIKTDNVVYYNGKNYSSIEGRYWASSSISQNSENVDCFIIHENSYETGMHARYYGCVIRPIHRK